MSGINIKKEMEAIDKQEKQLQLLKENRKSKCAHTKNNEPDIVPSANREPGQLNYTCRRCRKPLNLKKVSDDELTKSIDVLDRVIDTIKLTLNLDKEDEQKILRRLAKTQYRLRNELLPLYNAALKRNRGGNNKTSGGNNESSSSWGKPQIDR